MANTGATDKLIVAGVEREPSVLEPIPNVAWLMPAKRISRQVVPSRDFMAHTAKLLHG